MWKTQQKFEETVTVINEGTPIRGTGGIATITDGSSISVKMLMLPDRDIHVENRKQGQFTYERVYAQIRKTEMVKVPIIKGKTKVTWKGLTYMVMEVIDYTSKLLFQNAELELRRQLDDI